MRHQQIRKQLFPFSLHDLFITAGILACAVGICFLLRMADTSEGFASPVFVLAVLLISRFTTGYLFGVVASILSVISINYIFTYPYWAFNFTLSGYPLTFLTLLGASLLTCTMTTKIKEQERLRAEGEKEKVRASLLRSVSHDIRTPLTSIVGATSAVLETPGLSEEEKRAFLEDAREEAQWLIRLVENLLSITRIEDDKLGLKTQPELLEEIFQEALQHLDRNASQHQISVELEDDLLMANVDARLLVQVVINIVNNAIKYTPEGSHITLSAHREGDQVEVEIADDGPGIDQDAKDRIFDMFYTADKKRGDSRRGLGLGLSLCKSIINAHGGTIQAVDNHPQGTIFRFTLGAVEETNHE